MTALQEQKEAVDKGLVTMQDVGFCSRFFFLIDVCRLPGKRNLDIPKDFCCCGGRIGLTHTMLEILVKIFKVSACPYLRKFLSGPLEHI